MKFHPNRALRGAPLSMAEEMGPDSLSRVVKIHFRCNLSDGGLCFFLDSVGSMIAFRI